MPWLREEPTNPTGRGTRTGRALIAAGALTVVLLAGCGTPSRTTPPDGGNGTSAPQTSDVTTPTPTAPVRSVTAANLLTVDDVPNIDPMATEVVEAAEGAGRAVSQSYMCLPDDGMASLGATSMVTRDFTYKIIDADADPYPDSPLKNKPTVYTQALQFPDQASATAARATYAGWIKGCPKTLTERGYTIDSEQSLKLTSLDVQGGKAQAGMVAYVPPGGSDVENLYWESAGVTQVKDRLMLTVSLAWGMDTPGTFDTTEGDLSFINPQVTLAETAVEALAK